MKIFSIPEKISHHGAHSGYDLLTRHVPCQVLDHQYLDMAHNLANSLPDALAEIFFDPKGQGWYRDRSYISRELATGVSMLREEGLYHFLYGENSFRWTGCLKTMQNRKTLVTFHQPPAVFDKLFEDKAFVKTADAIIVVGTNQKPYFEGLAGKNKVYHVPHGVDAAYFHPGKMPKNTEGFTALIVGAWLRDTEVLEKIILASHEMRLGIRFDIVSNPRFCELFKDMPGVFLFSGISDGALREKYRNADVLLLPMIDSTANNSLLEAMACAKPVLTTRVGGTLGYLDKDSGVLAPPGEPGPFLEALSGLIKNPEKKAAMGAQARKTAKNLDWPCVGRQMVRVYEDIRSRP